VRDRSAVGGGEGGPALGVGLARLRGGSVCPGTAPPALARDLQKRDDPMAWAHEAVTRAMLMPPVTMSSSSVRLEQTSRSPAQRHAVSLARLARIAVGTGPAECAARVVNRVVEQGRLATSEASGLTGGRDRR
jgi:hypothetical protein